jgi:hypothetical protein
MDAAKMDSADQPDQAPKGISSLPTELMTKILGFAVDYPPPGIADLKEFDLEIHHREITVAQLNGKNRKAKREKLQLRLVCRAFDDVLTPMLFRGVSVEISRKMLEGFELVC